MRFDDDEIARKFIRNLLAQPQAQRRIVIDPGAQYRGVELLAPRGKRRRPLGGGQISGGVPHARVPHLVASLDVGVLPDTSFYACPLKIVEWMAAGRAIVAPRYGPVEDLLEDGAQGLLFPPRDLEALVAAVLRLVDQPRLRQELGSAAAVRAAGSLSWSDNARRVVGALEEAMGSCAAASGARPGLSPAG